MLRKICVLSSIFLLSQLCFLLTACENIDDSKDTHTQEVGDKYYIESYSETADPVANLTGMWMLVASFPYEGFGLAGPDAFPAVAVMGNLQERRIVAIQDYNDGTGIISSCNPAFGDIAWKKTEKEGKNDTLTFEKSIIWNPDKPNEDTYDIGYLLSIIDKSHMKGTAALEYETLGITVKQTDEPQALVDMVKISDQLHSVGEISLNIGDEPLSEDAAVTDTELFEYGVNCFYEQEATEIQLNFSDELENGGSFARTYHKLGIVGERFDSNERIYLDFKVLDTTKANPASLNSNFISFEYPLGQDFMRADFTAPTGSFFIDHSIGLDSELNNDSDNDQLRQKQLAYNRSIENGSSTYRVEMAFTDFKRKAEAEGETEELPDKFASGSIEINLNF